jgi:hypothetical protein
VKIPVWLMCIWVQDSHELSVRSPLRPWTAVHVMMKLSAGYSEATSLHQVHWVVALDQQQEISSAKSAVMVSGLALSLRKTETA